MKKTARIILAIIMVCISVFGLCSCGSDKKSIVGTWYETRRLIDCGIIFDADNKGKMYEEGDTYDHFSWKIYSKYTDKKNGEKVKYQPKSNYNGVLVISVDDDNMIFYYKFDDKKEKLYLLDVGDDEEVETVYIRR